MFVPYAEPSISVPMAPRALRRFGALALLFGMATPVYFAKGPEPPQKIPLEPMGFQGPGAGTMAEGASMSTVSFLDDRHLLVTFVVHRLMQRLPDRRPTDQDRTIEAVLLDAPTGEVLAKTEWRVRDPFQYLWNLGHGRLLLRVRDTLTTIAPMANLHGNDPFTQQPFLRTARRIVAVLLSPDKDLMTVETMDPLPADAEQQDAVYGTQRTQLNFFRLVEPGLASDSPLLQQAGGAISDAPVNISLTSAGYIEVSQESQNRWLFDFDPYQGKYLELSPFDTNCRPFPVFVSASEFIALGCRGGDDRLRMGGFDMSGNQMWQAELNGSYVSPSFAAAPAAGRFAMSRNILAGGSGMTVNFAPSNFVTEEIRVYQMYNGQQILQTEAAPVQRFEGNFDLSPDGMRLAVLRGDELDVYPLPPLTDADKAAVQKAHGMEPKAPAVAVNLSAHGKPRTETVSAAATQSMAPQAPIPAQTQTQPAGDALPDQAPRKKPTLYTLPGEQQPETEQATPKE